jgi:hypothetical protein
MANGDGPNCKCEYCRVHGLMGPVVIITIGVLFLIGEFTHHGFGQLWPLLIVVIGVLMLMQSRASREGHIGGDRP